MSYLKHITDKEFESIQITPPQVVYIGERGIGFIRYSAPAGYTYLDGSDEPFSAADTNFLIKK